MHEPDLLQQVNRTWVRHQGRTLSYFSGCDYFRLASHPAVLRGARDSLKKFGLNVSASRMTTGNHPLYPALEQQLAGFFNADAALLVSNGYVTSLVVAQAVAGEFSHALLDARAHPALRDAANLLNCPVLQFQHRDAEDFHRAISRCGRAARIVALTDGMFSHDGSIAPLRAYLRHLPKDGWLFVDDAHGAGVLGRTGQGSLEAAGVNRRRIVQCITLSKAFGAYGGAVLGSRELRRKILARSRMFIGNTPLPLPLAGAAQAAMKVLQRDKSLRRRLFENAGYVKTALRHAGSAIAETPGPIVAVHLPGNANAAKLRHALLAANIYPPFIKYPGGPAHGYFRFVISSEHSRAQLDNLLAVLTRMQQLKSRTDAGDDLACIG